MPRWADPIFFDLESVRETLSLGDVGVREPWRPDYRGLLRIRRRPKRNADEENPPDDDGSPHFGPPFEVRGCQHWPLETVQHFWHFCKYSVDKV